MTVQENISFITGQLRTFESMQSDASRVLKAKEARLAVARKQAEELRSDIRELKKTLISDSRLPSAAAIRERLLLETRVTLLKTALNAYNDLMKRLASLSKEWFQIQTKLHEFEDRDVSEQDEAKIRELRASLISQLRQYGFGSFNPDLLTISPETYRPTREGFDLGVNLSASDTIRVMWAYLVGMLEIAMNQDTNHLGLLVFDEPRQQQTAKVSFAQFARRAASSGTADRQVIFFTSEEEDTLLSLLNGIQYSYHAFQGKLLKKL